MLLHCHCPTKPQFLYIARSMAGRTGSQRPDSRGLLRSKPSGPATGSFHQISQVQKVVKAPYAGKSPQFQQPQRTSDPNILASPNNKAERRRSMDPGSRARGVIVMAPPPTGKKQVQAAMPIPVKLNMQQGVLEDREKLDRRGVKEGKVSAGDAVKGKGLVEDSNAAKQGSNTGLKLPEKPATVSQYGASVSNKPILHSPYFPVSSHLSPALVSGLSPTQTTSLPGRPVRPPSGLRRDHIESSSISQSTSDSLPRPTSSKRLYFDYSPGEEVVRGLRNFGNICYMNSIVQCLHYLPSFLTALEASKSDLNTLSKTQGLIYDSLAEVLTDLQSSPKPYASVLALKSAISLIAPQFASYNQHDAHECLRLLLDALHEELNRVKTQPPSTKLIRCIGEGSRLEDLAEAWWRDSNSRGSSQVTDLFQGQLVNGLTCSKCGQCKYTFEVFWDLSVSIPGSESGRFSYHVTTLVQCLDEFTSEKDLEGVKCKTCGTPQRCKGRMAIYRFPRILVLHLKRFAVTSVAEVKVNTPISCPLQGLDLSKYSTQRTGARPVYDLYGAVHHFGDVDFGHYYA